jgi:succinate dehydrogenase / fumarate reductase cytochrome b subunit
MNWLVAGFGSSIGTKFVMATTGLLLSLFVVAHMLGNLQVFAGREQFNAYAHALQGLGPLLWVARAGLLIILLVHVRCAFKLTQDARKARPIAYGVKRPLKSTYASRTMLMTGLIVFAFIVFHILHFTTGTIHSDFYALVDDQGRHDTYGMFVRGFQHLPTTVAYILAMGILGLHLSHGLSSLVQSMGWMRPKYREMIRQGGLVVTAIIVIGNISMPLACLLGVIKLPGAAS